MGWLGGPLAEQLSRAGHSVSGTTRNIDKAQMFNTNGIQTYLFDLYEYPHVQLPSAAFNDANVIINIPPGRKNFNQPLFIEKMTQLMLFAVTHHARHICFISTTSVFGNAKNEINKKSPFTPNTPSGEAHVKLEATLKGLVNKSSAKNRTHASVLRAAGLVSQERHPIKTLSKKSDIALGNNPVNLIHRQDVIQAICAVTSAPESLFNDQFYAANLCSSEHPSRATYYRWCAQQRGLPQPQFLPDTRATIDGKWINATQTIEELNLRLEYPSPYDMLITKN